MISKVAFTLAALFCSFQLIRAQQTLNETMTYDGMTRQYTVYVPAVYDGSSAVPLMFSFHGGGGTIAENMAINDLGTIADTANFIAVYPQALPDPNDDGNALWIHKDPTTVDDVLFIDALIDELSADYQIDQSRIYACGYSHGGEFTLSLGCRLNSRIAAIGVVARTMQTYTYNNCSPVHPTGVMTILGTADGISNYNGVWWAGVQYYVSAAQMHTFWALQNNCDTIATVSNVPNSNTSDGSTVERYTWSTALGSAYVEELKVIGGGHDWPGSFGNMDINATEEIWSFVSRYDTNGLINGPGNNVVTAICQDVTLQLDDSGSATVTTNDIDNGSTAVSGIASRVAAPTTFNCSNSGANNVTLTITSTTADTATCTATVIIEDIATPVFSGCPANFVVNNTAGLCSATPTWLEPSATDNCAITLSSNYMPGDTLAVSENTISYIAIDAFGNASTCVFAITVNDTQPPSISNCPTDVLLTNSQADCAPVVTWAAPSAADNCQLASFTGSHSSGDEFPPDTTLVSYIGLDASGNSDTCSFKIIVNNTVTDTIPPAITGCPSDMSSCSPVTAFMPPTVSDNCNVADFAKTVSLTTTFTSILHDFLYIATDDAGNADSCAFTITQYPLPVADAGGDQTITAPNPATLGGDPSTANGGTAPYSFLWFPAADLDDNTTEHPVASPSSTTDYIVFAIDDNGCAGTGGMTLTVNPAVNNSGLNKIFEQEAIVFPNPTTGILTMDEVPISSRVYITDAIGRFVSSKVAKEHRFEIDISAQPSGIYFLRIDGPKSTKKTWIKVMKK